MKSAPRLHMPLPATYQSPAQIQLVGDDAPRVPMPMYLIEHAEGLVLFDAGLDPEFSGDPVGGYGEVAERIRLEYDDRHLIEPYLAERGHSLRDVSVVVASHLHWDHIGGLKQFPNARILLGAGEVEYAHAPEKFAAPFYRGADFSGDLGLEFEVIDRDVDVFGDGSVTALWLPGHTPGSLGLQVRLADDTFVLSGDVVHTWEGYEHEVHYHGDVDSITARASLRRLKGIVERERAKLWIAHDPGGWETYGTGEIRR